MIVLGLHMIACGLIWWATFCRLRKMDNQTLRTVRFAIAATATGSATAGLAPIFIDAPVHISVVMLELGMAAQLYAFRHVWRNGTPMELRRLR